MKELTPEEKAIRLQQQLDFIDYMYPQISNRLAKLEYEFEKIKSVLFSGEMKFTPKENTHESKGIEQTESH